MGENKGGEPEEGFCSRGDTNEIVAFVFMFQDGCEESASDGEGDVDEFGNDKKLVVVFVLSDPGFIAVGISVEMLLSVGEG